MSTPSPPVPGFAPAHNVDIRWEDFVTVHLLWPLYAQLALSLLFGLVLGPLFSRIAKRPGTAQALLKLYVGTPDRPAVPRPRIFVIICFLQMFSSLVAVIVWAMSIYMRSTTRATLIAMLGTGMLDSLYSVSNRLRGEFRLRDLWGLSSIIDVVTIVPPVIGFFWELPTNADWITLRFLRAYCILSSYQRIQATGYFKHTGVMVQMIVLTTLRIYCLIIPMSGLLMTLEILGDPPGMADIFIETPGGDRVSFVMMVNWVMVSVVTLGDGTFSPKTVIGRCAWSVFLVTAVGYIFFIQFAFGQAWLLAREGSGAFTPRKRPHVVVILQVKGYASQHSSVVLGFLSEALNHECEASWPDIVFFCESYWEESRAADTTNTLEAFLKAKHFGARAMEHVHFIVGQSSRKEDLERASIADSAMTYILPDINTNEPESDDELNIFTALSMKRLYPGVRMRLMLLLPQSKDLAVQSGIMMERCFSVRELKAHLLAQNVRCHGLLPMITSFFKSVDSEQEATLLGSREKPPQASKLQRGSKSSKSSKSSRPSTPRLGALLDGDSGPDFMPEWVHEYVEGVSRGLVGFELSPEYSSLAFGELVATIHRGCGAVVVAVLTGGTIQICPQDAHWRPLAKGQVCFAIADSESTLDKFRDEDYSRDHWREMLLTSRDALAKRTALEGPHVAAARLLGRQLQDAILKEDDPLNPEDGDLERQQTDESSKSLPESATGQSVVARAIRGCGRKGTMQSMAGMSAVTGLTYGGCSAITAAQAVEEQTVAAVESVRMLRRQVGGSQDLVVLVVCQGEVWQQVRAFVSGLRAKYQPVFRPIVIFAPTEPPPRLLQGIRERVLTLVGSSLKVRELVEAGILEAGSVVVMAGDVPLEQTKKAPQLKDSRVVLCARMLECWGGVSKKEIFTTYELLDSNSVGDLPQLMVKPAVNLESFLAEKSMDEDAIKEEDEEEWEMVGSPRGESSAHKTGMDAGMSCTRRSSDNLLRSSQVAVESVTFNMRFAAGQVLTPEIWGCMLGRMYYNPAVIELSEALVMPQRRGQRAFPWQVRPPPRYIGRSYEELVVDLAMGSWAQPETSARRPGAGGGEHMQGPVVAMALYRRRTEYFGSADAAEGTGGNHYLVLGPPGPVTVQETDWVLVLGSRRFGRKALQLGLLRGSRQPKEGAPDGAKVGHISAAEAGQRLAAEVAADMAGGVAVQVTPPNNQLRALGSASKERPPSKERRLSVPGVAPVAVREPSPPTCNVIAPAQDAVGQCSPGGWSGFWREVRKATQWWGKPEAPRSASPGDAEGRAGEAEQGNPAAPPSDRRQMAGGVFAGCYYDCHHPQRSRDQQAPPSRLC